MSKESILIIEDESDILELTRYNLSKEGYNVTGAASGEDGLKLARINHPDLIILDLMLPGIDGLSACKLLKNDPKTSDIPVMMLTAKVEESDVVSGLELGADDYVTKPFSPKVLIARVRTILRRKTKEPVDQDKPLQIHDLLIHPGRHEVMVNDKPLNLTLTEFKILHFLARQPGWVFTRYQIVDGIHGEDYAVTDRAIDVQIVGLRKKMGTNGKYIETVRGVGYRFKD
ncbi:MAG: DNA-binding response regulator [Candidatus Schekmanbacteria bacterium RBG_13_48_7]|uniref:DNA-binding response regulator n=1 Tax=Candidatus Schekmanbacteria bacterium RBG_13_48_7 TaxID=1817878 RepID=A0A1F7RJI6_9BACT|nr:MAG: DNA-binding response regulator [Candidatus Schekmanbacteria bacterium RBG_13_48_7]